MTMTNTGNSTTADSRSVIGKERDASHKQARSSTSLTERGRNTTDEWVRFTRAPLHAGPQ